MWGKLAQHWLKGVCLGAAVSGVFQGLSGCSTAEIAPMPVPTEEQREGVTKYLEVPHPAGLDMGDIKEIFHDPNAPKAAQITSCDADFLNLTSATLSQDEIRQGTRELVRKNPVFYHWCFYGKLSELHSALGAETFVDAKQKLILDSYSFLVPVARAMLNEYKDSRYLRWATAYYQRLSDYVFFRKVELSPQGTQELVEVGGRYGLERKPAAKEASILEKYRLFAPDAPIPMPSDKPPELQEERSPAQELAPQKRDISGPPLPESEGGGPPLPPNDAVTVPAAPQSEAAPTPKPDSPAVVELPADPVEETPPSPALSK